MNILDKLSNVETIQTSDQYNPETYYEEHETQQLLNLLEELTEHLTREQFNKTQCKEAKHLLKLTKIKSWKEFVTVYKEQIDQLYATTDETHENEDEDEDEDEDENNNFTSVARQKDCKANRATHPKALKYLAQVAKEEATIKEIGQQLERMDNILSLLQNRELVAKKVAKLRIAARYSDEAKERLEEAQEELEQIVLLEAEKSKHQVEFELLHAKMKEAERKIKYYKNMATAIQQDRVMILSDHPMVNARMLASLMYSLAHRIRTLEEQIANVTSRENTEAHGVSHGSWLTESVFSRNHNDADFIQRRVQELDATWQLVAEVELGYIEEYNATGVDNEYFPQAKDVMTLLYAPPRTTPNQVTKSKIARMYRSF